MSQVSEINAILDGLGEGASFDQVELALRDYEQSMVLTVLADRSLAAGGGGGGSLPNPYTEPVNIEFESDTADALTVVATHADVKALTLAAAGSGPSSVLSANSQGQEVFSVGGEGSGYVGTLTAQDAGDIPLSIWAASGQTANLLEVNGPSTLAFSVGPTGQLGFYGEAPVAKPTGVAVTAEAIHAALVTLGLIAGP